MAKEKVEVVIPDLEGNALVLKNTLSVDTAINRLKAIDGFKYEIKEYKRSKDFKIKKAEASNDLLAKKTSLKFIEVPEETNSFKTEEDAVFGLLNHIGYTLEMEENYKKAISLNLHKVQYRTVYSQKEEESIIGEIGAPINKELYPAMTFLECLEFKGNEPKGVKQKKLSDYREEAVKIALEAKKEYEANKIEEEKKKKLAEEKEKALLREIEAPLNDSKNEKKATTTKVKKRKM